MIPQWAFWALGSAAFAGATAILAKIGVKGVDADLATAMRTQVVLAFAWAIVGARGLWPDVPQLSGKTLGFLVLSGLATGASWLCYFRALQLGPASRVAPLDKLSVVFVLVLSAAFLGEPINWKTALGAAFIVGGALLLMQK